VRAADHLADNVRLLRTARGLTQARIAQVAGVPRATWAHLEAGGANPTLAVLERVAAALQVSIEELLSPPRAEVRHYRRAQLPARVRGPATIQQLLPDRLRGVEIERLTLPAAGRFAGVPHTPGTREYLTCESGRLALEVADRSLELGVGDVVVFRGDQRHAYCNLGAGQAVGYSVLVLAPLPR
jgi:transcriptional regulator with XRE-family HTH domain